MKTLILISCSAKKLSYKSKAKELYTSELFKNSLIYARHQENDGIYILSAKHGLLDLDQEIYPYNVTLGYVKKEKRKPRLKILNGAEKKEWGLKVLRQLSQISDTESDRYIFLAGREYTRPLVPFIEHAGDLLQGLRQGERVKFLKNKLP